MDKKADNPLSRFERRKVNYPLVITVVVLVALLIAVTVTACRQKIGR